VQSCLELAATDSQGSHALPQTSAEHGDRRGTCLQPTGYRQEWTLEPRQRLVQQLLQLFTRGETWEYLLNCTQKLCLLRRKGQAASYPNAAGTTTSPPADTPLIVDLFRKASEQPDSHFRGWKT